MPYAEYATLPACLVCLYPCGPSLFTVKQQMSRLGLLRRNLDRSMLGAEIGPFFSPVVPRSEGWRTIVVDSADAEELRRRARTHDAQVVRDNAHRIEDVDAVWTGQPLDELCRRMTVAEVFEANALV